MSRRQHRTSFLATQPCRQSRITYSLKGKRFVLDSGLRRVSLSLAVVQGKGETFRHQRWTPSPGAVVMFGLQVRYPRSGSRSSKSHSSVLLPPVALRPSPLQPGKYFYFLIWLSRIPAVAGARIIIASKPNSKTCLYRHSENRRYLATQDCL